MNLICKFCGAEVPVADESNPITFQCPRCGHQFPVSTEDTIEFVGAPEAIEPTSNFVTPAFIGRYRILNEIGRSGASRVFQAHDAELDRIVALKLSLFASAEHSRFTREREIVSKLRHPHIVSILDYGIDDGREFVVSEYVEGESLRTWPAKSELTIAEKVDLCAKLAEALTHAHNQKIIHRDLKPANIIIDSEGHPRIVDFGVALDLRMQEPDFLGRLVGTPAYMAPEQTLGDVVDERSDIYAMGVILYELLTGKRPHNGNGLSELLRQIAKTPPPPMHLTGADVPASIEKLCQRCLAKNPNERIQTAQHLSAELYACLSDDLPELFSLASELRRVRSRNASLQREASMRMRMFIASQSEHQLYQALVEDLPLCVTRKNTKGEFEFANDTFCETVGYSTKELYGKTSNDIFSKHLADKQADVEAIVMSTGRAMKYIEEYQIGKEVRTFEVKRSPMRNFNAEIVGVQAIMWDVSAHARAESALRSARDSAEAASRAKSNFIANISHEIRTPMHGVLGLTEHLLRRDQDADTETKLRSILECSDTLLAIINNLLDFSKLEAGKIQLDELPFDIQDVTQRMARMFDHEAESRGLEYHCTIAPGTPQYVRSDPTRLQQVLLNLLGNAFKFTESGTVHIDIAPGDCNAEKGAFSRINFAVRDTGKGITPELQKLIFEPFRQEDESITRNYGGTGLGLAISSQLVELMGGEIVVDSEVGKGSIFHFTLNLQTATKEDFDKHHTVADSEAQLKPECLNVLVVEDNPIIQEITSLSLSSAGHQVTLAANGAEALQALNEGGFDIVLMDLQMPEMDGHTAAEAIREREKTTGGRVPIIAITAHVSKSDHQKCLASGMDGYLPKPIKYASLLRELDRIWRQAGSRETLAPAVERSQLRSEPQVFDERQLMLLVKDNKPFLQRMSDMLREDLTTAEAQIEHAIERRDAEQLARSLHKLLGTVRYFHGLESGDAVEKIKSIDRSGDWPRIQSAWGDAKPKLETLQQAVEEFAAN